MKHYALLWGMLGLVGGLWGTYFLTPILVEHNRKQMKLAMQAGCVDSLKQEYGRTASEARKMCAGLDPK